MNDQDKAKEQLIREQLVAILEATTDLVSTADPNGSLLYMNKAGRRMLGIKEDEDISSKKIVDLVPDWAKSFVLHEGIPMTIRDGIWSGELAVLSQDGREIPVLIVGLAHKTPEGATEFLSMIARDITERKRVEEEIRQKTEDLILLNVLNDALNRGDSLQEVIQLLARETTRVFSCYGATAYLLSEDKEHLVMQNFTLPPTIVNQVEKLIGMRIPTISLPLKAGSPYPEALQARKPQLINDPQMIQRLIVEFVETTHIPERIRQTLKKLIPQIYKVVGVQSVMIVPLVSEGEAIGLLELSRPKPFTESDLERFEAISKQLTTAIRRKQAEEALRRERDLAEALEEAAAVVSSTLDLNQVLDHILEQVGRVVPNDAANIMLIEGEQARIARWRGYERFGMEEFISTVGLRISEMASLQQMLESGEPIVIPDTAIYPGWVHVPVQEWLRSYAAAPIIVRSEVIGFLNVDNATPGLSTQAHTEALRAFADHAAAAIENARLYEAERQQAAELAHSNALITALAQVAARIETTLDPDQVMETLGAELKRLGVTYLIDMLEPDDEALVSRYISIESKVLALFEKLIGGEMRGFRIPRERFLVWDEMIEQGRTVFVTDPVSVLAAMIPDVPRPVVERIIRLIGLGPDIPALSFPLMIEGRVIGVLVMWGLGLREEDIPALSAFAGQVAAVLENARLYEQSQQRARELQAAYEHLQRMQEVLVKSQRLAAMSQIGVTVRHEINNPLTAVLGNAQFLLAFDPTLSPESQVIVREIEKAAIRIRDVVRKLNEIEDRPVPYLGKTMMIDIHGDEEQ